MARKVLIVGGGFGGLRAAEEFQSARLLIFIHGAIQDLTFSRGSRLITGGAPTDFNFNEEVASQKGLPIGRNDEVHAQGV